MITDDLMDATGVTVQVAGMEVTPDLWWPVNAAADGKPWTRVFLPLGTTCEPGAIEITATWGWDAIPVAVAEATILQAARLAKRRDAPFGVAGSPELGSELRLLAKVDPDVAVSLKHYVRRGRVG